MLETDRYSSFNVIGLNKMMDVSSVPGAQDEKNKTLHPCIGLFTALHRAPTHIVSTQFPWGQHGDCGRGTLYLGSAPGESLWTLLTPSATSLLTKLSSSKQPVPSYCPGRHFSNSSLAQMFSTLGNKHKYRHGHVFPWLWHPGKRWLLQTWKLDPN